MSRKPNTPIFENGILHHYEKPHIAQAMAERGHLMPRWEQRADGPQLRGYDIPQAIASDSNHTPCTLTKNDAIILATAGRSQTENLSDKRRQSINDSRTGRGLHPLPEVDHIKKVHERVAGYRLCFDPKATSIYNCRQKAHPRRKVIAN